MPLNSIRGFGQSQKGMTVRYQTRISGQSADPAQDGNKRQREKTLEEGISIHIFSTSATMVGVCLTVIGIFRLLFQLRPVGTIGDDLLATDAMLFLIACVLSYLGLRSRRARRRRITERAADIVFLAALSVMTLTCALITYAFV
jgi:hypothetical protein